MSHDNPENEVNKQKGGSFMGKLQGWGSWKRKSYLENLEMGGYKTSETSASCASCFIGGSSLRETDAATFGSVLVYRYTGADTKNETIHYNRKLMKQ